VGIGKNIKRDEPLYHRVHFCAETQDCEWFTPKEIGRLHTIIQNEIWKFGEKGPQISVSMIAIPEHMVRAKRKKDEEKMSEDIRHE